MRIIVNLEERLREVGMTSKELAKRIDITPANLSILKTGKAKGIRFSTLANICHNLNCQPGDILNLEDD